MAGAVSIGEAAQRVVSRTVTMMAFQDMLRGCPSAENRRRFINSAYANGALSDLEHHDLLREAQ